MPGQEGGLPGLEGRARMGPRRGQQWLFRVAGQLCCTDRQCYPVAPLPPATSQKIKVVPDCLAPSVRRRRY